MLCSAALVTVYISNKGPDAYRHDAYGDSIRIERKILQDGVGNYRIKNVSGTVISHKREELTAILDHHSIRIDNPLTILSQDNAREFLNSSTPSEKYRVCIFKGICGFKSLIDYISYLCVVPNWRNLWKIIQLYERV